MLALEQSLLVQLENYRVKHIGNKTETLLLINRIKIQINLLFCRECVKLSEGTNLRIHITTKLKETIKKSSCDSSNKYGKYLFSIILFFLNFFFFV